MKKVTIAVLALLTGWTPAVAQEVEMEVTLSGGRVADQHGAERTGVSIAPAIAWTDGLSLVALRASSTLMDEGEPLWSAGTHARLELVRAGFASLQVVAGGEALTSGGWRAGAGRVSPRLGASGLGWSITAGPLWGLVGERVATEVASGGLIPGSTRTEYDTRTQGFSGESVEGRAVQGRGSLSAGWTRIRSGESEWEDVALGGSLMIGGNVLGGVLGTRLGGDRASWAGASATVPVGATAAITLEGGRYPSDPLLQRSGGRYLTVGLRLRSGGPGI